MQKGNIVLYTPKIVLEILWNIVYMPIWWYTRGLFNLIEGLLFFLSDHLKSTALLVWIKNFFKPMYGQYDWAGILISLLVRFFQIIVRSAYFIFYVILSIIAVLVWLAFPIGVVYFFYFQIFGLN
jgi:hypothetical protein